MTAFDQSDYIQSMNNPYATDDNPEIITVQVVNPMLREFEGGLAEDLKRKSMSELKKNSCPKEKELIEHLVVEKSSNNAPEAD